MVRELPSGTVTFLFTDIEGSTRLLQELGEQYADALAEHRRVLRAAFARHGGVEVDTQGDAFFVAFARASDAVAAAADAQAALEGGPVRVRMGLHTGEPTVTSEGYVGLDVHRAARIGAAGHGGQVLLSAAVAQLLEPRTKVVRDLGEHRLKDLSAPERLFQLGEGEFPRLRTLFQTNLPVQPTPLVGRDEEIAAVIERLSTRRLVTLTGPGGVGKTRLAVQAAAEASEAFADGVFFVALEAVREPSLVLDAIEKTVQARGDLVAWLDGRELLLVLDNLEQVIDCGDEIARVVAAAPRAHVLCTSREPLRVRAESEYAVEPLRLDEGELLFRAHAYDAEPAETVRAICDRLDGLPLAIELAAARTRALPPDALLARLDRALPVLSRGPRDVGESRRTLRATIEWSYELLGANEQTLFRRLGVFAGGCTLAEAEEVAEATLEGIESLLEKAMLRRSADRYGMLFVIRDFALDQLAGSNELSTRMSRLAALLVGRAEDGVYDDVDNWRAAVDWAVAHADSETAYELALAGDRWRPKPAELLHWAERLLHERAPDSPMPAAARLLTQTALWHMFRGDDVRAIEAGERAVATYRALGDEPGMGWALQMLGGALAQAHDEDRATRALNEALALATRLGERELRVQALHGLGELERDRGNLVAARRLLDEALDAAAGRSEFFDSALLHGLGDLALAEGKPEDARAAYGKALSIARRGGAYYTMIHCLGGLAATAAATGRYEQAAQLWGAAERYGDLYGVTLGVNERARYERLMAPVPAQLISDAVDAWSEAEATSIEEVAAAEASG